ncbi:MAG TPA: hypothetical protein PKA90_00425 [Ignavibacteria bacterium]|nr:hypothetical protein [Ignavibacteria bacterium]HMR38869.1 hypothetical protein [Ignavibacteria bacterium]
MTKAVPIIKEAFIRRSPNTIVTAELNHADLLSSSETRLNP